MTARGNPYQNHRRMTYDCKGDFRYNFVSKSWKHDLWMIGAISFKVPYQIIEIWPVTVRAHVLYNFLSKSSKCDLWMVGGISCTTLYQNHMTARGLFLMHSPRNVIYDCLGPFPLQLLIKIIEIWPMTAIGNFNYNSLSKSMKYELWLLWVISFTPPPTGQADDAPDVLILTNKKSRDRQLVDPYALAAGHFLIVGYTQI